MNDFKKTVVAFFCTLLTEALLVWLYLALSGSLIDALRMIVVLVAVLIVVVLVGLWWIVRGIPGKDHRHGHDDHD